MTGVFDPRDGTVAVMAEMCPTCVFRPGNVMRLAPGRLTELVRENVANEAALPCHSTIYGQEPREAVCRGFFDRHLTVPLRLAVLMGCIVEVPPTERRAP